MGERDLERERLFFLSVELLRSLRMIERKNIIVESRSNFEVLRPMSFCPLAGGVPCAVVQSHSLYYLLQHCRVCKIPRASELQHRAAHPSFWTSSKATNLWLRRSCPTTKTATSSDSSRSCQPTPSSSRRFRSSLGPASPAVTIPIELGIRGKVWKYLLKYTSGGRSHATSVL